MTDNHSTKGRLLDYSDGVALQSTGHPIQRRSLWQRIRDWFIPPEIDDDALVTIEIDSPEEGKRGTGSLLNNSSLWPFHGDE